MQLKKEIPLLIIVSIPFLYLAYIWGKLPEKVPLHWNINGEIDRYGSKTELLLIPVLLPLLTYVLFLIIPKIDPKEKIGKMGNKYQNIKILLTTFTSILATFIIYTALHQSLTNPNYIVLLLGILYIILGNYFKTLKPNYFIGIKTPWTLENEIVWKKTHQLAGKIWFIAGLMIIISSLLLEKQTNFILFFSITIIITVLPVLYSFLEYKKGKKTTNNY